MANAGDKVLDWTIAKRISATLSAITNRIAKVATDIGFEVAPTQFRSPQYH